MTSPTAPGVADDLGGFEYHSEVEESRDIASPEPVPAALEDASPELGAADLPEPTAPAETTATSPAADLLPGEITPDKLTFPTGGTPFAFRIDGREVAPEGAVQYADGSVLLPAKAWDVMRGGFLADRGAWDQKERSYQAAVREARERRSSEQVRAEKILAEWGKVLAGGPEAVVQWAEDFERNRPILEARIEAQMAQAELERYRAGEQQLQQQQAAERLVPSLQGHLTSALNHYLSGPYKGVARTKAERDDLESFLWGTMAGQLFYEDEQGYGFRTDVLEQVLQREQARQQRAADATKKATDAARLNAAATSPTRTTRGAARPAPGQPKPKRLDPDEVIATRDYLS